MPTQLLDVTLFQPQLVAALKTASSVADARSKSPILACVVLKANPKTGLEILGTDMLVSSSERIPLGPDVSVASAGVLCVQARWLMQTASVMPAKPIRLRGQDNHWLELSAGRISMKLMGANPVDFPDLPSPEKGTKMVTHPATHISDLVEKTFASISSDEARVNLNGLFWECNGKHTTVVSTDGHRLTKLTVERTGAALDRGVVIPRKGIAHLRNMLARAKAGDIELGFESHSNGCMFARMGDLTLTIKLSGVIFPPYNQVIPSKVMRTAVVNRAEFAEVLTRGMVFAPEKTASVHISYNGSRKELAITANNPDMGVVNDTIDMVHWDGDHDILAGYNAQYLLDALSAILTKEVRLELQGDLDPLVIRPVDGPDFCAVVMPMRI